MTPTPDSSVLVPGGDPRHEFFELADRALAEVREQGGRLIANAIAEAYAVLTGPAFGWGAELVLGYLSQYATRPPVGIEPQRYPAAVAELSDSGVQGNAVYDGLIAIAARDAGLELVSFDRRARSTYSAVGVDFRLLQDPS